MVEITQSIKEYSRINEKGSNSHCSPLQGISVFYEADFFVLVSNVLEIGRIH